MTTDRDAARCSRCSTIATRPPKGGRVVCTRVSRTNACARTRAQLDAVCDERRARSARRSACGRRRGLRVRPQSSVRQHRSVAMPRCVFYCSRDARSFRATKSTRGSRRATTARPSRRWRASRACEASVTRDEFDAAIAAIHDALRAGDSYQVNYTYRLDVRCVRHAARAVSAVAGAAAGALRRVDRVAGGQLGGVVLAGAFHREAGRRAARAADERHRAARRSDPDARCRARSEESRRKRDDRRPVAQRHVARGGDGLGARCPRCFRSSRMRRCGR